MNMILNYFKRHCSLCLYYVKILDHLTLKASSHLAASTFVNKFSYIFLFSSRFSDLLVLLQTSTMTLKLLRGGTFKNDI